MVRQHTLQVLLVNDSDNESEQLISSFRSAGRVARSVRIEDQESLTTALTDKCWDLLVFDCGQALNLQNCIKAIEKRALDLPIILLNDQFDEALTESDLIKDIVAKGDNNKIVYAAIREVEQLLLRRDVSGLKAELEEVQQRYDLLLTNAEQAIAYIADGMVINPNDAFSKHFGYENSDDVDCLPVVDLIAEHQQEAFKVALKQVTSGEAENTYLDCAAISEDGSEFSSTITLQISSVDGERAVQMVASHGGAEGSSAAANSATSTQNNNSYDMVASHLANKLNCGNATCVLAIGIDDFESSCEKVGLSTWQQAKEKIIEFVGNYFPDQTPTGYVRDDIIIVGSIEPQETVVASAQKFVTELSAHAFTLDEKTLLCNCSIGIIDSRNFETKSAELMLDHALTALTLAKTDASKVFYSEERQRAPRSAEDSGNIGKVVEHAIEDHHLFLRFQPIISLRGAGGDHYETILSCKEDGDEFPELADLLADIKNDPGNTKLDRWILLEATKHLAQHRNMGNDSSLFINLTPNVFSDDTLGTWLGVALKAAHIPGENLIFQFLEEDLTQNSAGAKNLISQLREFGCRFSIDHFGASSNPLQTLQHINAHYVKLDKQYTEQLEAANGDQQEIRALINSIGENDARTIISDVENASVLAVLWQIGADLIQGNYLQAPTLEMDYEFTDIA